MSWIVPEADQFRTPFSTPMRFGVECVVIHQTITPAVEAAPSKADLFHVLGRLSRLVRDNQRFKAAVEAGSQVDRIIGWLLGRRSRSSTHFVILKDGTTLQAADPLEQSCWHAGKSKWTDPRGRDHSSVNPISIGIDLDNVGPLTLRGQALRGQAVRNAYGGLHTKSVVEVDGHHFEPYTVAQMDSLRRLLADLADEFPILRDGRRILGHEHVSPGRKTDPGPCLPWDQVRSAVSAGGQLLACVEGMWDDCPGVVVGGG